MKPLSTTTKSGRPLTEKQLAANHRRREDAQRRRSEEYAMIRAAHMREEEHVLELANSFGGDITWKQAERQGGHSGGLTQAVIRLCHAGVLFKRESEDGARYIVADHRALQA